MTEDDLRTMLRSWIGERRQNKAAHDLGVSPSFLCQMLSGYKPLNRTALTAIGVEKSVCYRRKVGA